MTSMAGTGSSRPGKCSRKKSRVAAYDGDGAIDLSGILDILDLQQFADHAAFGEHGDRPAGMIREGALGIDP